MADNCGMPTPATIRVVQIDPGPMPTFTASRARIDQGFGAFRRGDIAGKNLDRVGQFLDLANHVQHALGMAVRGIDDNHVNVGIHQTFCPGIALIADTCCGGNPEASLFILGGVGVKLCLFDVLDGDQADTIAVAIDNQKLFDPVLMKQALGLVLADRFTDRDQIVLGHQFMDLLIRIGGETHILLVRIPTSRPLCWPPAPPFSTTGTPVMP